MITSPRYEKVEVDSEIPFESIGQAKTKTDETLVELMMCGIPTTIVLRLSFPSSWLVVSNFFLMSSLETLTLSGSYTLSRPLFLQQGKLLLSSCGSIIQLISTATGELLDRLTGHQSNISSIIPHPTNSDYVNS
jgi:hypothetical protein